MRSIKFRGETFSGELVFGDVNHFANGKVAIADGFENRFVKPESVAQLVGYACDGNEVYEGDKVIDKYGDELTAVFVSGSFYVPDDDYTDMSHLKLKK